MKSLGLETCSPCIKHGRSRGDGGKVEVDCNLELENGRLEQQNASMIKTPRRDGIP
jgi:hypothetical protein